MSKCNAKIREEKLKHKVPADRFAAYDCTRIVGNIDFTVDIPAFTESEVGAHERFSSHFMADFMAGKQCRRGSLPRQNEVGDSSDDATRRRVHGLSGRPGRPALPGTVEPEGDHHSPTPTLNSNFNQQLTTTDQQLV